MADGTEGDRKRAVGRVVRGEAIAAVSSSLGYSREWLYKWLRRYRSGDPDWFRERSRRPRHRPLQTPEEVELLVETTRGRLEKAGEFSGAQAIRWDLEDQDVQALPSMRTINRILARQGLTNRRSGPYQSKGKKYPKLIAAAPGDVHQTDFVGPCYLRGGLRFYGLNSVDLATGRSASESTLTRHAQATMDAIWSSWGRLGMPRNQQVDNEMVFYGSPRYPRAMGPLLRLCLLHEIDLWFIPVAEPWRNGVVEKYNDLWQQKFLGRINLASHSELRMQNLLFEGRHNGRYRYSKLQGRTPMQALKASGQELRFPPDGPAPRHPLPQPDKGRYHLVRFVRSDGVLDVFGEKFLAPPECTYEYVRVTVDVSRQRLQIFLDQQIVDEHCYLRS
ncbi:MAG: IS481 family transposase [Pseudomonadales bacterium]